MNLLTSIRFLGGLAIALVLAGVIWLAVDRFEQKDRADAATRCASAAMSVSDSLDDCLPGVRMRIEAARQGAACNAALLPRLTDQTRFAAAQSCRAGVKRLIADFDATRASGTALAEELARTRDDMGSAIARAERRADRSHDRQEDARDAIATAPRGAGGSILCDAECLRRLGN